MLSDAPRSRKSMSRASPRVLGSVRPFSSGDLAVTRDPPKEPYRFASSEPGGGCLKSLDAQSGSFRPSPALPQAVDSLRLQTGRATSQDCRNLERRADRG